MKVFVNSNIEYIVEKTISLPNGKKAHVLTPDAPGVRGKLTIEEDLTVVSDYGKSSTQRQC